MNAMYTGPQIGKLTKVYCKVFNPASLEVFLYTVMDKHVYNIAPPGDLNAVVVSLLVHANQHGWATHLVRTVAAEFPQNAEVQSLSLELASTAPPSPVMPVSLVKSLDLQRIVQGGTHFQDFDAFLAVMKQTSRAVCRVALPRGGGTGFLVAPNLVITNFHVIQRVLSQEVRLTDVNCVFDHTRNIDTGEIRPGQTVKVDPTWQIIYRRYSAGDTASPASEPADGELDYAILRLEQTVATSPLSTAPNGTTGYLELAGATTITESNPLLIFQHPQPADGQLQLPLQIGNGVTKLSPWPTKRTRHDVPTLHGASGAPCFDRNLQLTAIHHAGNPDSEIPLYNQGIPIQAIVVDLKSRQKEFTDQGATPFWI